MATSVTPPRRVRRLNGARPVPCIVYFLCLTCLVACAMLTQLSFVHGGISRCGQRHAKTQVMKRMSQQRQESPKALAKDEILRLKALTSQVKKATRAQEVIDILEETIDGRTFDYILASAAYHKLATLKNRRCLQQSEWESPVCAKLITRLEDMVLQDELGARESATTLWSIAKFSNWPEIPTKLLEALVQSLPAKAKGMGPQNLSNCMLAFAQLKDRAPDVLEGVPDIVAEIIGKATGMVPQALSNSLWACAQLKTVAPDVLQAVPAIAARIPDKAKGMKPQELSNCLWACVRLKDDDLEVLKIVLPVVVQVSTKIKDTNAQDLSNNLEALIPLQKLVPEIARLVVDEDGEEDIVRSSVARLSTLLPRLRGKDLSIAVPTVVWACAMLGVYPDDLLHSISQHLGSRNKLSKLPGFRLCALAWSYDVLDAQDDFADFKRLLKSETRKKGFGESDVESTRLGPAKWNHAQLRERGPV